MLQSTVEFLISPNMTALVNLVGIITVIVSAIFAYRAWVQSHATHEEIRSFLLGRIGMLPMKRKRMLSNCCSEHRYLYYISQ